MAISLKNIEDRVKILEEDIKLVDKSLSPTNGFLEFSNGLLVQWSIMTRNTQGSGARSITFPKAFSTLYFCARSITITYNGTLTESADLADFYNAMPSATKFQIHADPNFSQGYWIAFGLKLYYNFSYNIIYKILSSIKFKISQIISSLKLKGGEDNGYFVE